MMGIKLQTGIVITMMVLVGSLWLAGCSNSKATSDLNTYLQMFEKKISELDESVQNGNVQKTADIEKEINTMKGVWTTKRNVYGDELTPQEMEQMVQKYNRIMARFKEIEKKKIG